MALCVATAEHFGIQFPKHSSRWAKLIRSERDLDLNERKGYAMRGPFVRWGDTVALERGQFLLLGARGRDGRACDLIAVDTVNHAAVVPWPEINQMIQDAHLPESIQAQCANSALYTLAAYCWVQYQTGAAQPPTPELQMPRLPTAVALAALDQVWAQVLALREVDQVEIRNRLLARL